MMGVERMGNELRTKQAKIENQKRTINRQRKEIDSLESEATRLSRALTALSMHANLVARWCYLNQVEPRIVGDLHRISQEAQEAGSPVPWEPFEIPSMLEHTWPDDSEEDE